MLLRYNPVPSPAVLATLERNRRVLRRRVAALQTIPDAEFPDAYAAMVAAVEAGFRHEEVLLEVLGGACPPTCLADHATLLSALHRGMSRVEAGDVELGRELVEALHAVLMLPWHAALAPAAHVDLVHHMLNPVRPPAGAARTNKRVF